LKANNLLRTSLSKREKSGVSAARDGPVRQGSSVALHDAIRGYELLVNEGAMGEEMGAASRVVRREPAGFELVEAPHGRFWTVLRDRFLGFTRAQQELEIYGEATHGVEAGNVVLDCGPNVGGLAEGEGGYINGDSFVFGRDAR
jgi:hypothetical protein